MEEVGKVKWSFLTVDCLEKGNLMNEQTCILGEISKYGLKNKHLKAQSRKGYINPQN